MREAFAQGWIVDLILALVAVEAIALAAVYIKRRRASSLPGIVANLLAGAFLLVALRCALVDADWRWIALSLAAALVAHTADMAARWRH